MKKIALITGANKGIGLETARQLAKLGIDVIVGSRDSRRSAAAVATLRSEGLLAEPLLLDVTSEATIGAAADAVRDRHGRLDILVNNAGVSRDDPSRSPSQQTLAAWRETFETNLFGMVAVTQAFMPLLRQAPAARIVNVSSILGSLTLHSDPASPIYNYKVPAYNVSKSAVNAWTISLAYELRDTPIKVNAGHPGHVKTDMGGASAPMELVDGARTNVMLATLGPDGPTGGYFHLGKPLPW